jgi:hypothetical protein
MPLKLEVMHPKTVIMVTARNSQAATIETNGIKNRFGPFPTTVGGSGFSRSPKGERL